MSLYQELLRAGQKIENHESDLYVEATPKAIEIAKFSGRHFSYFKDSIDGNRWIEAPGAYDPFWEARAKRTK